MIRHCGRWYLGALLLLGADWRVIHAGVPGGLPERALHLLLLALLGFALARGAGRRGSAVVLGAWWSALLQLHLAFVPGAGAGVTAWLPDALLAGLGAWWAIRPVSRAARTPVPEVRSVAVLSEFSR